MNRRGFLGALLAFPGLAALVRTPDAPPPPAVSIPTMQIPDGTEVETTWATTAGDGTVTVHMQAIEPTIALRDEVWTRYLNIHDGTYSL